MARIYRNLAELIGRTPLLELVNYRKKRRLNDAVIAKLEYFNPANPLSHQKTTGPEILINLKGCLEMPYCPPVQVIAFFALPSVH
ncbi:MAG: hypothetical protein LBR56_06710 [Sporomusaceae bacterium]|jgi:cysteine synthase|nr:hypothetical protein [Sporomusaceae bacterium]